MTRRAGGATGPRPGSGGAGRTAEDGLSLPELLVTMLLMGMVGTIVMALTATMNTSFTRERAATDSTSAASTGMNELTRVLRSGTEIPVSGQTLPDPAFAGMAAEEIVLNAYLDTAAADPQPIRVRFALNAQRELVETRWTAVPTYVDGRRFWTFPTGAAPALERTVARMIPAPAPGDAPLFTFLDRNSIPISPLPTVPTASDLRRVAAVRINLTVQADPTGRARPVSLRNTVGIPNLGVSRVGP